MDFIEVWKSLLAQDWIEWTGLITGLVYVILATRNNPACWIWGIISCAAIAYKDFTSYLLYQDGILQLFYVLMGFWGLYNWKLKTETANSSNIQIKNVAYHLKLIALGIIVSLASAYVFQNYTTTDLAYIDAFTTVFAILATYLLVKRIFSNWYYWIIINGAYVYIYYLKDAALFSMLLLVYLLFSFYGAYNWRKLLKNARLTQGGYLD